MLREFGKCERRVAQQHDNGEGGACEIGCYSGVVESDCRNGGAMQHGCNT